ncbi:putative P-loop containing nucleoside triphosphate hydrolase [Helianthus anomalus]
MSYAGVQMFMEKLNQLINCYDIPFINNPEIIIERPQFQLLYAELGSMIRTLFFDECQDLHEHEGVKDLKKRFTYAAEEAQYIVDLFLSNVHIRNIIPQDLPTFEDVNPSLNLDDVRKSFSSILKEINQSASVQRTLNQPAQISISRTSLESERLLDEIFVGFDRDFELIRGKLVEDTKKIDVVSIVGMGGIGKTTLATKVFNDGFVKYHFHVRVWVTVSQIYDKRDVLIQILLPIRAELNLKKDVDCVLHEKVLKNLDFERANDSQLHELVHKNLMGKRCLIVIDDIWHIQTWDKLKLFFPNNNNGSRILLTTRLAEVAKHANPDGLIHRLGYLNTSRSFELLCQKVFQGNECPEWSIKPGMQIVENCHGLPLAVVVIARVLAKDAWNEMFWVEMAYRTGSYIVSDENGCLKTLALSYNHLPLHLRECFLYFGGFPEDYTFQVQRLIWLWMAEGFIQDAGDRNLEDIADSYLMDLIDRNLVIVANRVSDGGVKACKVHDLVRELCLQKAREEQFILKLERPLSKQFSIITTSPSKPVRMFTNKDLDILDYDHIPTQNLRSILWFSYFTSLSDDIAKIMCSYVLLRVLDLQKCELNDFPKAMESLVHLRYLAIWISSKADFPDSICKLWNLQTLVCLSYDRKVLPTNISDLVNLRHLWSYLPSNEAVGTQSFKKPFFLPSIGKPMKLQTISNVELGDGVGNFQKCFPYIKELTCTTYLDKQNDFKPLTDLEKLKLTSLHRIIKSAAHDNPKGEPSCGKIHITFPETLKTLTLVDCRLPWSDMSIFKLLVNLQVLKLHNNAFEGSCWNTDEQEFKRLKFLRLERLNIKLWGVDSKSFPCLSQLEVFNCLDLEEIPLETVEIPTLKLIKIRDYGHSLGESVRRIQEQNDLGNCDIKIDISMEIQVQF